MEADVPVVRHGFSDQRFWEVLTPAASTSTALFDPAKPTARCSFNVEHPDPKDPLHTYGVDDGFGYVDPKTGRAHKFIGYYAWKYWDHILGGEGSLANAYPLHRRHQVRHKAAVLLDRIADVYPAMDWKPYADRGWYHSDGGARGRQDPRLHLGNQHRSRPRRCVRQNPQRHAATTLRFTRS